MAPRSSSSTTGALNQQQAVALERALRQIDRNAEEYNDKKTQDAMLTMLIEKYGLRYTWGNTTGPLNTKVYRGVMQTLSNNHTVSSEAASKPKRGKIHQLFLQGSEIVQPAYREAVRAAAAEFIEREEDAEEQEDTEDEEPHRGRRVREGRSKIASTSVSSDPLTSNQGAPKGLNAAKSMDTNAQFMKSMEPESKVLAQCTGSIGKGPLSAENGTKNEMVAKSDGADINVLSSSSEAGGPQLPAEDPVRQPAPLRQSVGGVVALDKVTAETARDATQGSGVPTPKGNKRRLNADDATDEPGHRAKIAKFGHATASTTTSEADSSQNKKRRLSLEEARESEPIHRGKIVKFSHGDSTSTSFQMSNANQSDRQRIEGGLDLNRRATPVELSTLTHATRISQSGELANSMGKKHPLSLDDSKSIDNGSNRPEKAPNFSHVPDKTTAIQEAKTDKASREQRPPTVYGPSHYLPDPYAQAGVVGPAPGVPDNDYTAADTSSQWINGHWDPTIHIPVGSFCLDTKATVASREKYAQGVPMLGDEIISGGLASIWEKATSISCNFLKDANMEENRSGELVFNPTPDLEMLYRKMFGEERPAHGTRMRLSDRINHLGEFLAGFMVAAIQCWVWDARPPTEGPQEIIDSYTGNKDVLNRVLRDKGCRLGSAFQEAVWQAARIENFDAITLKNTTLKPHANKLAYRFVNAMYEQLLALGGTKEGLKKVLLSDVRINSLTDLFGKALSLRCQMRASPETFRMGWISSGVVAKTGLWEPIWPAVGEEPEANEVVWTVQPVVWKHAQEKPAQGEFKWLLVSKGKINNMPVY